MTRTQERIRARIIALAGQADSGWEPVPGPYGLTIRHTAEHETPEYHRRSWDQDTYSSHVFVTLTHRGVIIGSSAAPWMRRDDRDAAYWLAEAVLEDRELAFDTARQLAMKAARKA